MCWSTSSPGTGLSWRVVSHFVDILPGYKVYDGVCPGDTSKSSILTLYGQASGLFSSVGSLLEYIHFLFYFLLIKTMTVLKIRPAACLDAPAYFKACKDTKIMVRGHVWNTTGGGAVFPQTCSPCGQLAKIQNTWCGSACSQLLLFGG